uniref:CENP-V/GFA domain-containing protein n=1 Tax=Chromera velia CCMP2878 TaxID=1169474 RepID=A0A0G4ICM0_9ALVE|eukprot:Cvel_13167.t1-p1 / transcript=Cvel_13167.t1 / gene=Cvel_13167 / organism=Chromera_velia_CCMP2878 / gene_product=hypothetical protein / transcript_product=hypothetical protein / location=Cvel_scaffold889:14297-14992(-) / protein_length=232 / sequence_SO=supercontig / SO=protein_coding / is_pseudo=false
MGTGTSLRRDEKTRRYTAKCSCGSVEFELYGSYGTFGCCCADCLAGAKYVDEKAEAAGKAVQHISVLEPGKPQSVAVAVFPPSRIKCVKGREHLRLFKLTPNTQTMRFYTECCLTAVMNSMKSNGKKTAFCSFNVQTLSPTPALTERIYCREALRKADLPQDGIPNNGLLSFSLGSTLVPAIMLGYRSTWEDKDGPFLTKPEEVTEIAGPDPYERAGFKAPKPPNGLTSECN